MTRSELEASQMQKFPTISRISDAVAKQMSQRPKKAEQFQKYSTEWKKLRDAKVEEKREQIREKEIELSQSRGLTSESRKYLPAGYKGPISGYYEQVNRYFEKKSSNEEKRQAKRPAMPQINRLKKDESCEKMCENETVEERLLRKGQEYKNNKVQTQHDMLNEETFFGPQYQPKLVSNNQAYLPDKAGKVRYAKILNENTAGVPIPENLTTHEMLYYDAMVGMV